MKKFKLIKEYPGSPKLGFELNSHEWNLNSCGTGIVNGHWQYNIFKSPDFWQEVVQKDYEILSFIYDNDSIADQTFKHFSDLLGIFNSGKQLVIYGYKFRIHSVKRLSNGEVFTIGDKVTNSAGLSFVITKFYMDAFNEHLLCSGNNGNVHIRISKINHAKKVILITEDGVEIETRQRLVTTIKKGEFKLFSMDDAISIHLNGWYTQDEIPHPKSDGSDDERIFKLVQEKFLIFSTKRKAEEYVIMNKPCLSINDLLKMRIDNGDDEDDDTTSFELYLDEVQKLVKSKLK